MRKVILVSTLLFCCCFAISQEICNNSIDDDADGFIDLQDPDCHCGAGLNAQFNNAIPNPSFDQSSCCPQTWNDHLNCLNNWTTDTSQIWSSWYLYYANSCNGCNLWGNSTNWINPPNCGQSGNHGFLGMGFWNNWNNNTNWNWNRHANVCLNTPFIPGNSYVLEFDAFNAYNWNWNGNGQNNWNDTVRFTLSGTTSCANIPFVDNNSNTTCLDPDWDGLDSLEFVVPTDTAWHTFSFTFSPTDTIYGIALGQSCGSVTNNNNQWNGWQRLLFDNLTLYDSENYNIQIAETGSICSPPHVLNATIDTTGGTWQWYQDSVALVGETSATIDITAFGDGNFTALYSMNNTCQGLNFEVLPAVYPLTFVSADNSTVCVGDSIYFDGFSFLAEGTIDNYYYSFDNGDSAFVEDVAYAYNAPGVYTVVHSTASNVGCTAQQTATITVHPKPAVDFITANQCLYTPADFISLTTLPSGYIDSLSWEFGDNNFADDSLETHQYASFGNYNVKLYARSDNGCVDSAEQVISIHAVPEATYTAIDECENIDIAFNNASSIAAGAIINYDWTFGDNSTANVANVTHTYLSEGTYATKLVVTSDSGCVDSANLALEIHPEPIASFTPSSSCYLATFVNNSTSVPTSPIVTSNWDFGNNITASAVGTGDTTHYYATNANYNITLQSVTSFGCVDDTIIPITISSNFFADFTPKDNSVCVNDCVQLFKNTPDVNNQVVDYFWRTFDGQTSTDRNPKFCFNQPVSEPTDMGVFLKISTSSGCIDSIEVADAISIIPIPIADFTFTPEKPERTNPEVTFKNLSTLAVNYEWNFGNNNYSNDINPIYTYPAAGKQYTVRLKAFDAENTCYNEHSELLIVEDDILFFIPNSFTPDGSGNNDLFMPQFVSGVDIYNYRMQIFNRWGEIIFESNDPLGTWNGIYAGEVVIEGVYLWKIDFIEAMVDKTHTHSGTVNVLR